MAISVGTGKLKATQIRKSDYVEHAAFFVFEKNNVKIAVGHKLMCDIAGEN